MHGDQHVVLVVLFLFTIRGSFNIFVLTSHNIWWWYLITPQKKKSKNQLGLHPPWIAATFINNYHHPPHIHRHQRTALMALWRQNLLPLSVVSSMHGEVKWGCEKVMEIVREEKRVLRAWIGRPCLVVCFVWFYFGALFGLFLWAFLICRIQWMHYSWLRILFFIFNFLWTSHIYIYYLNVCHFQIHGNIQR